MCLLVYNEQSVTFFFRWDLRDILYIDDVFLRAIFRKESVGKEHHRLRRHGPASDIDPVTSDEDIFLLGYRKRIYPLRRFDEILRERPGNILVPSPAYEIQDISFDHDEHDEGDKRGF